MMPANVFQLELSAMLTGRRTLLVRLMLPLLLGLPFVSAGMPAGARSAGLAMLVLFTSVFGPAVAISRRREDGRMAALAVLPIPKWLVLLDVLLAGTVVRILQLLPIFVLFLLFSAEAVCVGSVVRLLGLLGLSAAVLGLGGMLLGLAARSNAEVHLFSALATAVVALLSGLFPISERIAWFVKPVAAWNPVAHLASSLRELATGNVSPGLTGAVCGAVVLCVLGAAVLLRACDWKAVVTKRLGDLTRKSA